MPRNVEDIIPRSNNRRSIRDIPIPINRRKIEVPAKSVLTIDPDEHAPAPKITRQYENHFTRPGKFGSKFSKKTLWGGIGLAVLVLVVAFFALPASATLSYTPKSAPVTFTNDSYTAYKTADSSSGKLLFSVIQLTGNKSTNAPASGTEQVSTKASGTIIIYNNTSSASQKLIANTRFQTSDGKIYRIQKAITIPGQTISGGQTTPGSIEASVVADQPGADYNIGLEDFTVPGFQGDPRFTTIYARSKTPMTGGLVGTIAEVGDADIAKAKAILEAQIKTDLLAQARAQVPADFILFPDLSQITYSLLPQGTSTASTAVINEQGNFTGVMFKKSDLAQYLAVQKLGATTVTGSVEINDFSAISVVFAGTNPDLLTAVSANFQVSGTATIDWVTDESALAQDLEGKSKSDLDTVLANYPSILTASATVRPFWKGSFPSDAGKITIEEKN